VPACRRRDPAIAERAGDQFAGAGLRKGRLSTVPTDGFEAGERGSIRHRRSNCRKPAFPQPRPGKLITSPFGNRKDPFFGKLALHTGTDFHFSPGEKVRATAPGKIISAGWAGGYGNMVEIDHGEGITTRYGHMQKSLCMWETR